MTKKNSLQKFRSLITKKYKYLLSNETMMLIVLLSLCLLIHLPKMFLIYEYGRPDYPGGDASNVLNGAENIKENGTKHKLLK